MSIIIRFDDSLPAFAGLVRSAWGADAIADNLFLRDASGRLTLVLVRDSHTTEERMQLANRAVALLGSYVDRDGFAIATHEELFDDSLASLENAMRLPIKHELFDGILNLVDRRIVGADWLNKAQPLAKSPARFVFASIKGGVGRSTALCVVAADLSSRGRRVLAIDMDLEAPGLGNLLLPNETLPEFGLLDYLAELESGNPLDDTFFADLVGPSWLGGGLGKVDVIPAIGRRSLSYPENVLSKLARAYLSGTTSAGESLSFTERMRRLVDRFADPSRYDAILVDARAGLHETTAAAVLGLGANVLLFGMDQPQTYSGYELLFAHLRGLPKIANDNWEDHLYLVQSKAMLAPESRVQFSDRMNALVGKYLRPEIDLESLQIDTSDLRDTFDVYWDEGDEDADAIETILESDANQVVAVFDDERFRVFDPIADRSVLVANSYSDSYKELLELTNTITDSSANKETSQ